MDEDEEYDSDSTVLLTDYVDKPERIDFKRRRLGNLHDRANLSDEFEDENTAPPEVSLVRRTDNNWQIIKYFESVSKNNNRIQNNNSRNLRNLDFNENLSRQVPNNSQTDQSIIPKRNTTNINTDDQIICLDSDEEAQNDDKCQDHVRKGVETSARYVHINNSNSLHNPAPITNRRAAFDYIERNEMQLNANVSLALEQLTKMRVSKPSIINSRRTTPHFDRNNLNCNIFSMKDSESNEYINITSRLPKSQCADANTSTDASADCNNITGISAAIRDKNTHSFSLPTSKKPLKTDTDQSNSFGDKDFLQDTGIFLNVTTQFGSNKRFGSNNETQKELKRIKIDVKSTDPEQFNKNTSTDSEITTLEEIEQLEASEQYVRSEICVTSAECKAINNQVESERSTYSENKANEAQNTTGVVIEKRALVDAIDEKLKTTVNNTKSGETTSNEYIQITALNANEKLEASEIHMNVSNEKHKAKNYQSERNDGHDENKASHLENTTSVANKNSIPTAKTLSNVCENRETRKENILQETSEIFKNKEASKVQDTEVTDGAQHRESIIQDKQETSDVIDKRKANKVRDNQDATKEVDEFETSIVHDEQVTCEVYDKQDANKLQDNPETSKLQDGAQDKNEGSKVHSEHTINGIYDHHETTEHQDESMANEAQHMLEASKILDKLDRRKTSDKQEINKVQDDYETSKPQWNMSTTSSMQETSKYMAKADETYDSQNTDKVNDPLATNNVQDAQIPSEVLDKETIEPGNKQELSKVSEKNVNAIQDKEATQKLNNENKICESTNVQETIQENETTREESQNEKEDYNDRVLKFQVGFFTLVKEYLKDIFPVSATELHNLIENIIIDTRNGQVQTDVRYSCPKCSHVSNYSSRILNNAEIEDNIANAEGIKKCGFCNGIRKLHNSYLKRFLCKKYVTHDKKELAKTVSSGANRATQAEQTREEQKNITGEIVISNSPATSEAKTDSESTSLAAVLTGNSCSYVVDNDKQVKHYCRQANTANYVIYDAAERHPGPKETTSKKISLPDICSSIDNNVEKDALTSLVATGIDTIKLTCKEVSDQDKPITKGNEISAQNKHSHMDEEAPLKTDPAVSNKRKSEENHKEIIEHKRAKTVAEENNAQGVKNLTAIDGQTNIQRIDKLANERPNKVHIISIQRIMSHRIEGLNNESDLNNDKMKRTVNSQPCDKNTPEKSSYELTKMFQRSKSDNIIIADAEELDKRGKHFSKDANRTIEEVVIKNMLNEESHVKENEKDKGNIKYSNSPPARSVPKADEANSKQMNNIFDKVDEDVLKPLMDCFTTIKNSVKDKESTPKKSQYENETAPESASKIRSKIRSDRSNSLNSLRNRDDRKVNVIVMKYVCPICTTIYVYPTILLRHMKERHNPNLIKIPENCERLQCPFCRILLSNKNYNKHVKLNHSEKYKEIVDVVENSNTDIGKNKLHGSFKNTIFLNRQNTESNKASESTTCKNDCSVTDKIITTNNSTTQDKKTYRSELKYQHLIGRIKIGDVNNDAEDEIDGDENKELDSDEVDTQDNSIENEDDSSATINTGEIISRRGPTSGKASVNVKHTQQCCPDKSTELTAVRNTLRNEEECASSNCNNKNVDAIENSDVYSLRNDNMHNINETCHGKDDSSKSGEIKHNKSNSEENINNPVDDEKDSRRSINNESETSNSDEINKETTILNTDETFAASCSVEHGKQNSVQLCIRYENNDRQSTENTTINAGLYDQRSAKNTESSQTTGSNNDNGKETDSEEYCIKASNYAVKKRNERITKLFGDENEASVSNKINELKSNDYARSEQSNLTTKTERPRGNRHRKRKVTVKQYTENAESSDSDWIISSDDSPDSYDQNVCPIKKNHAVRKLFISKNERSAKNGRNKKSCFPETRNKEIGSELLTNDPSNQSIETYENSDNNGGETIKPWKYSVNKKKERLSKLFGDDNESCVSDKLSEKGDRPADSENNVHSDRCTGIEESVPSNCVQKVPSDNETLKVSEHMVKKRMERVSKHFADDEALPQNSDSNQQMEDSDISNVECRIPIFVGITTKDVNANEEYVMKCSVEIPKIIDNDSNNENSVNEKDHQETNWDCDIGGADRNDITAVAEEEYVNTVNAEKSRDDDRIEINMIDRLLKELASDDHQNGACTETVNHDDSHRKSEVRGESQATSESTVKTCFENIRITNVNTVEGKIHVFICQECNYGTDAYDDAIRHCQNHYNLIEDQVTYCFVCQINYDTLCFERHQASHDKYLGNMKIKFSYRWLFTNWQAIFENEHISLSEAEDMQMKSIYKTFCVKMTVKSNGPWHSAVYLCAKCNKCVLPLDIEKHVQQKCTFVNYPCRTCDRVFSTYELRTHHEIYHTDDSPKVFKTIVFNDHNDQNFNSKLIKIKALIKEKSGTVDIFKCLCGLCFISLKRFKLHFADCDSELNDGKMCPKCTGKRKFSTTELEEHLLLHHSLLNYEIRVQKIKFQQESIIDLPERETPLKDSDSVDNAAQITSKDEDLSIKRDMLKDESLTQNADKENWRENLDNTEGEYIHSHRINETVPEISDVTTENAAMTKDGPLTHNSDEENRREHIDHVEEEDTNKDLINETSDMLKGELMTQSTDDGDNRRENIENPDSTAQEGYNDEDLNVKRDMLKAEILSQNTKKQDINSAQINETVPVITDSTAGDAAQIRSNDEDLIIKREMLKDEILSQNTEKEDVNSNEINKSVSVILETAADDAAQIGYNDDDMMVIRDTLKDETLTKTTNEEIPDSDATEEVIRAGSSQEIEMIEDSEHIVDTDSSQEVMEVEQSVHPIEIGDSQEIDEVQGSDDPITNTKLIIIEDSDDEDDIQFIGESFPNTTKIFPLRNFFKK